MEEQRQPVGQGGPGEGQGQVVQGPYLVQPEVPIRRRQPDRGGGEKGTEDEVGSR
jgi:hypothetical protein